MPITEADMAEANFTNRLKNITAVKSLYNMRPGEFVSIAEQLSSGEHVLTLANSVLVGIEPNKHLSVKASRAWEEVVNALHEATKRDSGVSGAKPQYDRELTMRRLYDLAHLVKHRAGVNGIPLRFSFLEDVS